TSLLDIIAEGGAGAKLTLDAAGGIGDDLLRIQVSRLDATTGGALHIEEYDGPGIGTVHAGGAVMLTAGGSVAAGTVESVNGQVALTSTAGGLDLGTTTARLDVSMNAGGGVAADTIASAAGSVRIDAGGGIAAATTEAGQDIAMRAA